MAVAANAVIEIHGQNGLRRINSASFFRGLYATDLEPTDILTAVEFPKPNLMNGLSSRNSLDEKVTMPL